MLDEEIHLFLKALASEKRQEMMFLFLEKGEITVNEVAERIGIGQSTASEQLAILKRAGILLSRKKGKEVYYFPNKSNVMKLLQRFTSIISDCCK
ncbi:ArsR/SmtB family transcription factor [Shimazuella alba]|jgi:ArsR family transcriptional regulator|nr:metalloregulator ArsR/SmtB family transcription factor [Shimazuella alba]